jgi:aminoglycoside phosphotransferase (APT) family kinase protein
VASHGSVGVDAVRDVVATHAPDRRVESVRLLGEGLDHVVFEVDGDLVVRFARRPDAARLDREVRLLAAVAAVSPVPVPEPVFADAARGCLAYRKLAGVPLLDLQRSPADTSIAATIGWVLAALHALPVAEAATLVDTDDESPDTLLLEAAATYPAVSDRIPPEHRGQVEAFLDVPPPVAAPVCVFSHNDLGIEHVLVAPAGWPVTGVVDWGDAAVTDPARDFGRLHRDLGPTALAAALEGYRSATGDVAALRDRAVFHARCGLLEDLAYGLETGRDAYVGKSLAALAWLFPAAAGT